MLPAIATALKEAGAKLSKTAQSTQPTASTSTSSAQTKTTTSTTNPANTPSTQSLDDALVYLNQWVLPPSSADLPNTTRPESFSVGGHPSHQASKDAQTSAHNLALAAKAVAEGRAPASSIPLQDLENLGVYAAEVLGGYVVQGLEALVGAGLGLEGMASGGMGLGMGGMGGTEGERQRGGRLLSVEEAEQAMVLARKETESLEKKVNALMKRNKRILNGAVAGR